MTTFTLHPVAPTASFKKIVTRRKWVGRIVKKGDGSGYYGVINGTDGKTEFEAATEGECFDGVVARHLGYANVNALHQHNARIRQQRKVIRYQAQAWLNNILGRQR